MINAMICLVHHTETIIPSWVVHTEVNDDVATCAFFGEFQHGKGSSLIAKRKTLACTINKVRVVLMRKHIRL